MGRNTWNLWSAGNAHFWNHVAQDSYGLMDLLKMLDNRKFARGERFKVLGLVNEPGFRAASKPDEFGLWLDEEVEAEPAGIDQTVYGKPSGVLGFRLFPNPDFNDEARKKWNGDRFMNDATYYNDNKLIRPYRVGVACGSCHIAPNPSNPPLDPENPRWENLASAIGNQYINEGKVFACNVEKGGFFYEMLAGRRPFENATGGDAPFAIGTRDPEPPCSDRLPKSAGQQRSPSGKRGRFAYGQYKRLRSFPQET